MWSDLAVVPTTFACKAPFSFYFDLIEKVLKASDANNMPLHRLCTLARKQGVRTVIIEPASGLPGVFDEVTELDRSHAGGGGAAEAIAISFFACDLGEDDDLGAVDDAAFLGQAIVINYRPPGSPDFTLSYVFEAVLPPPALGRAAGEALLLNNYMAPHKPATCLVRGRTFTVEGVYFCQQNRQTHVCAHACLRMAVKSSDGVDLTAKDINTALGVTPPCDGLSLGQIVDMIHSRGLEAEVADCEKLTHPQYVALLASIVESGDQALLVFKTGNGSKESNEDHVVLVFGHTRHSDEWHPQAEPAYGGPGSAHYLSASAWIDHFLIHDDNLGPYYTLSSHALERDPDLSAHWIIAVRRKTPGLTATGAEAIAALNLTNTLPLLAVSARGRWFDYLTSKTRPYVLRTILISREAYIEHLGTAVGHDETSMRPEEIARFEALPDRIWMVEFSLPSLFTGNRSKLGEVLLHADPEVVEPPESVFVGLRVPNLMLVKSPAGDMIQTPSSLESHSPVFRRTSCGVEW
jgi:hypothetical protein